MFPAATYVFHTSSLFCKWVNKADVNPLVIVTEWMATGMTVIRVCIECKLHITIPHGSAVNFHLGLSPFIVLHGDRLLSPLHTRMRNNCSKLKCDLFVNHLSETSLCVYCNVPENAKHYFFHCTQFTNEQYCISLTFTSELLKRKLK